MIEYTEVLSFLSVRSGANGEFEKNL